MYCIPQMFSEREHLRFSVRIDSVIAEPEGLQDLCGLFEPAGDLFRHMGVRADRDQFPAHLLIARKDIRQRVKISESSLY